MKSRTVRNLFFGFALPGMLISTLQGCGSASDSSVSSTKGTESTEKIGLLFASHGDIDDADKQLEDYIKVSFQKNVGIPLPMWTRKLVEEPAYRLSVKTVRAQYDKIGPTRYYANSLKQIEAINEEFKTVLPNAKAYVGFNFTYPFIDDAMESMKKDGITKIVIINKGAQFSYASSGENMEDVLKYLKKHPEYDVEVLGVASYGHEDRYTQVMAKSIDEDIQKDFPGVPRNEICIMLGSHGLPVWIINKGDSAITQMKRSVVELRKAMPEYKIYHGFLNDDFFPGAKWVSPNSSEVAPKMVQDACKYIAMDGRLSFTTHHRATLYDMNVVASGLFAEESAKLVSQGKLAAPVKSVLLPNFDANKDHARFIAQITKETLEGKGLNIALKRQGQPALEPESVGKPGLVLKGVTHLNDSVTEWSPYPYPAK